MGYVVSDKWPVIKDDIMRASSVHLKMTDYFIFLTENYTTSFEDLRVLENGFTCHVNDLSASIVEERGLSEGFKLLFFMARSFDCKALHVSKKEEVWPGVPRYDKWSSGNGLY